MKKFLVLSIMMFLFLTPAVNAVEVEAIQIIQTLGGSSTYSGGTINWSGGVTGWIMTDAGNFYFSDSLTGFTSMPITANFTSMTDTSSGGVASASFASGTWSISLNITGYAGPVAYIAGHLSSSYNEAEVVNEGRLEGKAVVIVDTATFNDAFWTTVLNGSTLTWDGIGELAGIISNTYLPSGTNYQSYATGYSSENMIVTLYADESQIPEPATMLLLSIGGLLLRKRS